MRTLSIIVYIILFSVTSLADRDATCDASGPEEAMMIFDQKRKIDHLADACSAAADAATLVCNKAEVLAKYGMNKSMNVNGADIGGRVAAAEGLAKAHAGVPFCEAAVAECSKLCSMHRQAWAEPVLPNGEALAAVCHLDTLRGRPGEACLVEGQFVGQLLQQQRELSSSAASADFVEEEVQAFDELTVKPRCKDYIRGGDAYEIARAIASGKCR